MAYSTILKPSDYFNTLLYSGNSSVRSLTGVGFEPSWVWIKERSSSSDHMLFDQPRGVQKYISSNLNNVEQTSAGMLTAFGSDGFSLGNSNDVNDNGQTYASFNWKANGQGSANTAGSINTTYTSANTTNGVSICKWVGTQSTGTIAHGLGTVPKIYFVKNLDSTDSWNVFANTGYMDANYRLLLDTNGGRITDADAWNSQNPTSSFFTVGSNTGTNKSGSNMIAYVFSEVKGFSKFSEYTGNGNADGTFVYTGFKPAWVLIKDLMRSESWYIYDGKILGYNGQMGDFLANTAAAEGTDYAIQVDLVSNGIKFQSTTGHLNGSNEKFLYMAFAESPFVANSGESIPTTAR